METITINLTFNKNDYPVLFQFKNEEINNTILKIFNVGYTLLYPILSTNEKTFEHQEIISKIESLKNGFNNTELNNKIGSLDLSLQKLIGLSDNSSKKGQLAENILENIFIQRYGDIDFENKSQNPHCGDGWLTLPNKKIIMLESKNYTTTVDKHEITKCENDMITNNIKMGIFVSFNSKIQGFKELDIHTFYHENQMYQIIMIANLSKDISRLDLALSLSRKLIDLDIKSFPWIVNNISSELEQLNELLQLNYLLRDNFINMERDILKNINYFYTKLRDYQNNLDNKVNDIINKINNTMENSIKFKDTDYSNFIKLCSCKDNKLGIIASKIADVLKKKFLIIKIDNNIISLLDKNLSIIGNIKIQIKKISIELINFDILLSFQLNKDKETTTCLHIFENLNL
jgi:hypothetical protein